MSMSKTNVLRNKCYFQECDKPSISTISMVSTLWVDYALTKVLVLMFFNCQSKSTCDASSGSNKQIGIVDKVLI